METLNHAVRTNPTPEEIAAAHAILAAVEQGTVQALAVDTEQAAPEHAHGEEPQAGDVIPAIDQATVTALREALEKAVASRFFMSNPKRVAALESALTIPVSDDKSFQQFYNHAEKDLEAAANKAARKNRAVPEEVTRAMVMEEAQRRYVAKHGKRAIVNEEYET
jgi:hypothetical protein